MNHMNFNVIKMTLKISCDDFDISEMHNIIIIF